MNYPKYALTVFLTVLVQVASWGDPLDVWIPRTPALHTSLSKGISFNGVQFANDLFVAVGDAGAIRISQDADYWGSPNSGTSNRLYGVAYGSGVFAAVGEGGTLLRSPNGYDWQVQNSPINKNLRDITFFNGAFVAVGDGGTVLISSDAKSWTLNTTASNVSLYGITSGNGLLVAVGGQSVVAPSVVLTSPDGVSWRTQDSGTTNFLRGVHFGNGTFVAVGNGGSISTSTDGEHWTRRDSRNIQNILKITFGNGSFVAIHSPAGSRDVFLTSTDGVVWQPQNQDIPRPSSLKGLTFGVGQFVAVGDSGSLVVSRDGVQWDTLSLKIASITGVAYGNGVYVAVGFPTSSLNLLYSTNGINWTRSNELKRNDSLWSVAFGGGQFVAVGLAGLICSSPDGRTWKQQAPNLASSRDFHAVVYAQGIFVAVGPLGVIFTSTDGIAWVRQDSGTPGAIMSIAYGNGLFVAGVWGQASGGVLTSSDGFSWDLHSLPELSSGQYFLNIAYGDGVFCASFPPNLYVSSDGVSWAKSFATTNKFVTTMCFGNGSFLAAGIIPDSATGATKGGFLLSSRDGTNWVQRITGMENLGNDVYPQSIAYGDGSFVLVGGSLIIQSGMFTNSATLQNSQYSKGTFSADVNGPAGQVWRLQIANELSPGSWTNSSMVTNWISPVRFVDTNTAALQRRFYRLVPP